MGLAGYVVSSKNDMATKLEVWCNQAFWKIMKYDQTCSASGMFVRMSFCEVWQEHMYNCATFFNKLMYPNSMTKYLYYGH